MSNILTNNNDYAIEMFSLTDVYQKLISEASSIGVPLNAESGHDSINLAVS
jgi:hypothetical protein